MFIWLWLSDMADKRQQFLFNGMGAQYAIAVPDKDIVFVINSDNQGLGSVASQSVIINTFFEKLLIIRLMLRWEKIKKRMMGL